MKKKVLALMLSAALICSSATVAFAAGDDVGEDNSIENVEEETGGEITPGNNGNDGDNLIPAPISETGNTESGDIDANSIDGEETDGETTDGEEGVSEEKGEETDDENAAETKGVESEPVQEENTANGIATLAENGDVATMSVLESGTCGDNLTWTLTDDGTLTISGTGAMDIEVEMDAPWVESSEKITKIIIEEGVTSIGDGAFSGLSNLTETVIPNSVVSIGNFAFIYCDKLHKVSIPENVTSIGEMSFSYCESLSEITIPGNLKNIAWSAFSDCTGLKSISISSGVEKIDSYAFSRCISLEEVIIPDSVTSIGYYAFGNCVNLKNVEIPDGLTDIGVSAFDDTVFKTAHTNAEGLFIVNGMVIESVAEIDAVDIPDSVRKIVQYAFRGQESLRRVSLPNTVNSIGRNAFQRCSNLTDINIPNNLTTIQYSTFSGCESLASVDIPTNVTTIEEYAFYKTGMTSVTIPETVTSIGEYAFGYTDGEGWTSVPMEGFTIYGYTGSAAETYANENSFTFIALNDVELAIVADRTDGVYIKGSGTGATIYCTGEFDKFVSVEMDGKVVDPSNYTVVDGSTVLTFASAYLDTLATGRHTVTLNYIDGSISTTLTILDEEDASAAGGSGTGNSTTSTTSSGSGNVAGSSNVGRAAKTGDQANIVVWMILGVASSAVCITVLVKKKKSA